MRIKMQSMMDSQEKEASMLGYFSRLYNNGDPRHERFRQLLLRGMSLELTDRQRSCISMKYLDGMKAEEIASALGLSISTVYKHIRTGFRRLRRLENYL